MNVFHISAECFPVAKVGGLADVVGALPKYLNQSGITAKVVVPAYDTKFFREYSFEKVYEGYLNLGHFVFSYSIHKEETDVLGFELYAVAIHELFDRTGIYSYEDDTERFLSFQIAFLNWITETNQYPDLVHIHDHHTGLIPFMMQQCHSYQPLKNVPVVLSIHNAQYQGWFGFDKLHYIPQFDLRNVGYLEWKGIINPLASAIKCAWRVTTVSPGYLDEVMYEANGLENLLRFERPKCLGILNGIDTQVWNPETDSYLKTHYTVKSFKRGKKANKKELCEIFNLNPDNPLFIFIGRLVGEKGADLLPQAFNIALNEFRERINILVLGSGDTAVESHLEGLKHYHNGDFNAYIGYNEELAHCMYAGADFLLMPSRVEPCGLNQMYAMRYGTIPVVRRTGGLKNTVTDMGDGGFGICHDKASVSDIMHSVRRAVELYADKKKFENLIANNMNTDHSWENVASQYINVYQSLIS